MSGPQSTGESAPPHEFLELVRVVDRTTHDSTTDRNREKEFVVRNNTSKPKDLLFLPLVDFRIDLEVHDEDGTKLNFFPNDEVEEFVDELKKRDPEAHASIKEKFDDREYMLLVQLPQDNPIRPGEFRSIKLNFRQSKPVQYHRISDRPVLTGWVTHWKRKLFTIPSFVATAEKSASDSHAEFFVVEGPEEYATVADKSEKHQDKDGFYENGYGKDTRVLSTHLPPAGDSDYTWELTYELVSDRRGLMNLLALFWWVGIITAVTLLTGQLLHLLGHVSLEAVLFDTQYETIGETFSTGIISGFIGVIYGLRAEWTERYRILCLVPLLAHITSWTIWNLIP